MLATGHDCSLRLFRADGSPRMTVALPRNAHMPAWGKALCLANLDGDGKAWPVVGTAAWRVHPVAADGTVRWTFDTTAHAVTCLAAGDLNGDGRDEIAIGTVYFCIPAATADGSRLWQDEDYNDFWRAGPIFPFIATADVDGDRRLEVITVGSDTFIHCISHLGEKKWTYSVGDEAVGLALLSQRIAVASLTGDVHLVDGRGRLCWRVSMESPCTALTAVPRGLAVGVENGNLIWLGTTGKARASARLKAPTTYLLAGDDGRVLAATADARLSLAVP